MDYGIYRQREKPELFCWITVEMQLAVEPQAARPQDYDALASTVQETSLRPSLITAAQGVPSRRLARQPA
jgi:hypothetical protein